MGEAVGLGGSGVGETDQGEGTYIRTRLHIHASRSAPLTASSALEAGHDRPFGPFCMLKGNVATFRNVTEPGVVNLEQECNWAAHVHTG